MIIVVVISDNECGYSKECRVIELLTTMSWFVEIRKVTVNR